MSGKELADEFVMGTRPIDGFGLRISLNLGILRHRTRREKNAYGHDGNNWYT
jgi:hypothetical protein